MAASPDEQASFVSGTVFAGRYRMVTRVGRGGMGEVWRADDLVLNTAVALKLVYSASGEARMRLLREVRLARQITHGAVCRVFDVGDADGQVFYSMEFIEGEDLATLLRRAGRLPQERVLEIGRQLCDGVAAAHAQGVLHRDLKPANVLVDQNGDIRITDFGIAIARTDSQDRTLIGTPGYMAPEQLTIGAPLSEQTDIYAIGLILYELLVGERPFADSKPGVPPRPSAHIPDVDPQLERVILKALSPVPHDRPATAGATAAALPLTAAPPQRRRVAPWLAGAGLAAAVALLAVLGSQAWPRATPALTDQDTIVLADFSNTTGEPVFDGTLKVALAVALEQSPFLKVFPDDAISETLRLMERQPDEKVTRSLARDIALREQLKALVSGSIGPLGSHYVIALEAVNAESGDIMAREQVEATSKEQVLTALGGATAKLREKLGESLPSIQKFDAPLARATTSSLEALHAYSLALDDGRVVMRVEAIPHLKRAVEIDPEFALAHALLSGIYANTGQVEEAPPHARRAYELRDRVSERERYFISWRYFLDAEQSWDKALPLASAWTDAYPRESFAFNSLGIAAGAFGQRERAVAALRQAIRLDPRFIPPHRNLAANLIALNRFDEAKGVLDDATRAGVKSIGLRQVAYLAAFVTNDHAAIAEQARQAAGTSDEMWSLNSQARGAVFSGRIQTAHTWFQQSAQLALRSGLGEIAANWTIEDAEAHAVVGQCAQARSETTTGLGLARDNFTLERAARALALCGAGDDALRLRSELQRRFPEATLTMRVDVPIIEALVAMERGEAAGVRELLKPVEGYDHAPGAEFWPLYLRGRVALQLKDAGAAASEFQRILDRRGEAPTSALYPLAQLGLARATAMAGDTAAARTAYQAFLALWSDADTTLPALKEAREELARLR
ncbi:MAG: protein kinase [Vicinamibacterales bacterium]